MCGAGCLANDDEKVHSTETNDSSNGHQQSQQLAIRILYPPPVLRRSSNPTGTAQYLVADERDFFDWERRFRCAVQRLDRARSEVIGWIGESVHEGEADARSNSFRREHSHSVDFQQLETVHSFSSFPRCQDPLCLPSRSSVVRSSIDGDNETSTRDENLPSYSRRFSAFSQDRHPSESTQSKLDAVYAIGRDDVHSFRCVAGGGSETESGQLSARSSGFESSAIHEVLVRCVRSGFSEDPRYRSS